MENNIRIFIFGDSFASNLFQEYYEKLGQHHIHPHPLLQYLLDLREEGIDDALWFSDWLTKWGYEVHNFGQGGSDNLTILEQFSKLDSTFRKGDRIIVWLSSFSRYQWINEIGERWSINAGSNQYGYEGENRIKSDLILKQCINRENSFKNGYLSRVTFPFYEYFFNLHSKYNPIIVSFCSETNHKFKKNRYFFTFENSNSTELIKFNNSFKKNISKETNGQIADGHYDRKSNHSYAIIFDEIIKNKVEIDYSQNLELLQKIKKRIESDNTLFRRPKKWDNSNHEPKKIPTNLI